MTTYYGSQTLTPIEGGTRATTSPDSYELTSTSGDTVALEDNTSTGNTGIMDDLLLGGRTTNYTAYSGMTSTGTQVSADDADSTRNYDLLAGYGIGTRKQATTGDDLLIESRVQGERVAVIRSGAGAFGIGYTQQVSAPADKRIRRWPRDWHGDNMTN